MDLQTYADELQNFSAGLAERFTDPLYLAMWSIRNSDHGATNVSINLLPLAPNRTDAGGDGFPTSGFKASEDVNGEGESFSIGGSTVAVVLVMAVLASRVKAHRKKPA